MAEASFDNFSQDTTNHPSENVIKTSEGKAEAQKIFVAKLNKILVKAAVFGLIVPFMSLQAIGLIRNLEGINAQLNASTGELGGEFDPALGAEINAKNGRALIVVHEGYGADLDSRRWQNDAEYQAYLQQLEDTKAKYLESGDVVVLVYDQKGWYDTRMNHKTISSTFPLNRTMGKKIRWLQTTGSPTVNPTLPFFPL